MHPAILTVCGAFSYPQEADPSAMSVVVVEHAKGLTGNFLTAFSQELRRHDAGLHEFIEQGIESPNFTFEVAWDSVFPGLFRLIHTHNVPSARNAAVALGLRLGWAGVKGGWAFAAGTRTGFRWGEWPLPAANSVRFDASENRAAVTLDHDPFPIEFARTTTGWERKDHEPPPAVKIGDMPVTVHTSASLESIGYPTVPLAISPIADILCSGRAAADIIERHAPVYLRWVRKVLRHIVPVSGNETQIRSGSDYYRPGVVEASFPVEPVAFAEVLVHECSHQYLNWLSRLGPLVSGSDTTLYFSPVKQQPRSLINILVAYHAFANVLIFYRLCLASGLADGGYSSSHERKLIPQLEELEVPLRTTGGLTPLGDALWRPAAAAVRLGEASVPERES